MDAKIELRGMEFHAFHGCLEQERREGNTFIVDLEFVYDASGAAADDDLQKAVDYGAVYEAVAAQMAQPSNLLENVAWRIREAVATAFPDVRDIRVRVSKKNPPVAGRVEWSSVEI